VASRRFPGLCALIVSALLPWPLSPWPAAAPKPAPAADRRGPTGASTTPSVAFDPSGRLWSAWTEDSHIYVASSADAGRSFGAAVRVTPEAEETDANGESRPKIAVGPGGEIYATWTRAGRERFTGDIRFSRSVDGGRSFSTPRTLNDDARETGHRFDALHVGPTGVVYVAWIDKRDLDAATAAGRQYSGAALYYTHSVDRGATFAPNRKLKDHVCECCRLAIDFDGGVPVVFWRDVYDGTTRDHGLLRFDTPLVPGRPWRATKEGWTIDACPHHGPSLSIARDGTHHLVWFTGEGPQGPGAFYARSTDRGRTLTPPRRIGSDRTFGHASVLSRGAAVYLAIKEPIRPSGMSVQVMTSRDAGATWSPLVEVLRTQAPSDHPFLIARGDDVFLSWFTKGEGLRVVPVIRP
jgi:hypothetical protein